MAFLSFLFFSFLFLSAKKEPFSLAFPITYVDYLEHLNILVSSPNAVCETNDQPTFKIQGPRSKAFDEGQEGQGSSTDAFHVRPDSERMAQS
jgi:hypothetical protein